MNIFKRIIGHVYFFYGMFLFLFSMLIIALPGVLFARLFKETKRIKIVHRAYKIWISVFLPFVFCYVRCTGRDYFEKGENYVVVVNHNALVDIPISTPWIPGANKTLAKIELAKIPIFSIIYKAGSILLDRKSDKSRKESFIKMRETLNSGIHLCLYPEGTRNKTDKPLLRFKDGAFVVAIRSQKAIIAGVLRNTKKILPMTPKFWAWPNAILYDFLPPISTKGLTMADLQTLKKKVHDQMEDVITKDI